MPQAIAHRGYKARHPENTLAAFRGAVDIGAHALETDVHLSRDDVVVLSHVREQHLSKWTERGASTSIGSGPGFR